MTDTPKRPQHSIDRRTFLAASATGLGLAAVGHASNAKPPQVTSQTPLREPVSDFTEPDRLLVTLMADPQIPMEKRTPEYVKTAMDDLAKVPHDFMAVLGDLAQNNPKHYEDYERLVLKQSRRPLWSLAGNADIGSGLDEYKKCTGLPLYYTIYVRGIRFIFTSAVAVSGRHTHICDLGPEQLAWLTQELASDNTSTTVLFSHAPLFESTWHSEDRSDQKFPGSMYLKESKEVRRLLARHRNVKLYAHGHLHHAYGVKDDFGRGEYALQDGVLHISVGATANNRGSSVLSIEKGKIVATVRDHKSASWKPAFTHTLPVETTIDI